MGMFDTIHVAMECPYCGYFNHIDCQTKDLDNELWEFSTLPDDWWTGGFLRHDFYSKMPVQQNVPHDKAHTVWDSIAERKEIYAKVADKHKDLTHVNVICECDDCKRKPKHRFFDGKIKIQDGYLTGSVYDIICEDTE